MSHSTASASTPQSSPTVMALPEKYRAALVLHSLEGYPVDAVAAALRLTPSAVKMRLKRGRELLQTMLAKEDIHV